MIWHSHLFKNFPQFVVIHGVKGFSIVNEAVADFLKMEIQDHLTCFLRNLYADQEATVRTRHGTKD